jgi:hypothetical protein
LTIRSIGRLQLLQQALSIGVALFGIGRAEPNPKHPARRHFDHHFPSKARRYFAGEYPVALQGRAPLEKSAIRPPIPSDGKSCAGLGRPTIDLLNYLIGP